jgi:RNA polymerase sigma factor (sigma-70 family)
MCAQPDGEIGTDRQASVRKGTLIDALYRKYHRMLRAFLLRRHVGEEEAADIVQETYWRILKAGDPETIRYPRAFLLQVASRVLLNHEKHRRAGVEQHAVDIESVEVEADEPSAYRRLRGEQEWAIVRTALEELSPKCREVFVMNRFEHLSYAEISTELDLSISMIEKYVSQALAHLRKRVAESANRLPETRVSRPTKSRV